MALLSLQCPFHFRWTVMSSALGLGRSDRAQPIMGNSECVVTWCPVVRHCASVRAQKCADNCAQTIYKSRCRQHRLLQCPTGLPWGSPLSLSCQIFPQRQSDQRDQHHRACHLIWPECQGPPAAETFPALDPLRAGSLCVTHCSRGPYV